MSKTPKPSGSKTKNLKGTAPPPILERADPYECPFREFRDSELGNDLWGLNAAACRAALSVIPTKPSGKLGAAAAAAGDSMSVLMWVEDQPQPLPKSVRQYLHKWVRAEALAEERWDAKVVVFEEAVANMTVVDWQLSHAQVLLRSTFCRKVLSACFMLERAKTMTVEHQDENFSFTFGPEGWRAKYLIYSQGMKSGGGIQHKPGLSRNGCYLVRLYYLGAWRCVWVSDLVPVDISGAPLLPFSPLYHQTPSPKTVKGPPISVTSQLVHMWPLLICKALLKLWAPEMTVIKPTRGGGNTGADKLENLEDEPISELNLLHTLTGGMGVNFKMRDFNPDYLWEFLSKEVPAFDWDEQENQATSKGALVKKAPPSKKGMKDGKETDTSKENLVTIFIKDTREMPVYALPGITPALETDLLVIKVRDVPLKKPLPEPEVPLWKTYRWVDWARRHGLYDLYDCPRTRYLKVNGLLKLFYAPHLLDIQSTMSLEAIVLGDKDKAMKEAKKKPGKEVKPAEAIVEPKKDEIMKEWVPYNLAYELALEVKALFYTSFYQYASCVPKPPIRPPLKLSSKPVDVVTPRTAPLYMSIDSSETNELRISLCMLNPRILKNTGVEVDFDVEKAYIIVEVFDWFVDKPIPKAKAFVDTVGYDTVEVTLPPGRHYCRLWIHSRLWYHVAMITKSNLLLATKDVVQSASIKECPWISKFLLNLSNGFFIWIRVFSFFRGSPRSKYQSDDREFFKCYQPDLNWDPDDVGYPKCFLHWMFRQALQSLLSKRLPNHDYQYVCNTLRWYLMDPDFGFPPKPLPPPISLRTIANQDPCDCSSISKLEAFGEETADKNVEENKSAVEDVEEEQEEKEIVSAEIMNILLQPPEYPNVSNRCKFATEEVPCNILRDEVYKVIHKHEAATLIQAHWRGFWARHVLKRNHTITQDVLKIVMDNAFGPLDALSRLMKEFFSMFPGTKTAYSISSALPGLYGLQQYSGIVPASSKWIPFFQGVFYCHRPVKVHFDIISTIKQSLVVVYDNDSGEQMPQVYNAHITIEFHPNVLGYTVMGHGTLIETADSPYDAQWQLTILTSIDNVFHICDNEDPCNLLPLTHLTKFHLAEFFVPNRRNIMGGIQISVTKLEAVSFRAEATLHDLRMEAVLKTTSPDGQVEVLGRCHGIGEIFWSYLRLKPWGPSPYDLNPSQVTLKTSKSVKSKSKPSSATTKETTKKSLSSIKLTAPSEPKPKVYTIEVTAPNGWGLSVDQWRRVIEARNQITSASPRVGTPMEQKGADKGKDQKGKDQRATPVDSQLFGVFKPTLGDAFTVLECAISRDGTAVPKRDDERDVLFFKERRSWSATDPARNARGEEIRREFREEFLLQEPEMLISPVIQVMEEGLEEHSSLGSPLPPSPSRASVFLQEEAEEEGLYYTMPDSLRDKFEPLYFVPVCTKTMEQEKSVLMTPDIAQAAERERNMRIEAALARMHELQAYNETHVLGRQKNRSHLLEQLGVGADWNPTIETVLAERDEMVTQALQEIALAATAAKKKVVSNPTPAPKKK